MANDFLKFFESDELKERAKKLLSDEEKEIIYTYFSKGGKKLAPEKAAHMFSLFLQGYSTQEIYESNKAYPLGAIIYARIADDWDHKKQEYAAELQARVKEKLVTANLEAVNLLSDFVAAITRLYGDKFKKFLVTRDEKDLPAQLKLQNLPQLLKLLESLQNMIQQPVQAQQPTITVQNLNALSIQGVLPEETKEVLARPAEALAGSAKLAAKTLSVIASQKRKTKKE